MLEQDPALEAGTMVEPRPPSSTSDIIVIVD